MTVDDAILAITDLRQFQDLNIFESGVRQVLVNFASSNRQAGYNEGRADGLQDGIGNDRYREP